MKDTTDPPTTGYWPAAGC